MGARSGRQKCQNVGRALVASVAFLAISGLLAENAFAGAAVLTPGHAYCYYFSSPGRWGGMHLVAASPTVIASGPSNYVSGTNGKPQDTVFYIDCVPGHGRTGGDVYIGLPRMALHRVGAHFVFSSKVLVRRLRHIGVRSRARTPASLSLTGSVSTGVINGVVRIDAPGCLPSPITIRYSGR